MGDPALAVERIGVVVGGHRAVRGVDLVVESGERVAVLGPSGCGKTTLLRAIAGLVPVESGVVRLDGREVTAVAPHRRNVGLMFQDNALFPHLDVAGNVAYGLRMHGWSRDRRAARVAETLEMVGLTDRAGSQIADLSGGEQQRVALARTLAPEPSVVLLDEPLGSLDRALRERLADDLARIFTTLGTTAVFVTHDQSEALVLGQRVAVMRAGELVQVAPPDELWSSPASAWVARFLGRRSIVSGEPWEVDGEVLVPPAAVRIGQGRVSGTVTRVRFVGRCHEVAVDTDVGELWFEVTSDPVPEVGEELTLVVDPGRIVPLGSG